MRLISDLVLENENLKFKFENGITNILMSYITCKHNNKYMTNSKNNNLENELYFKLGAGELLENNEIFLYFVLNKIGTRKEFIISSKEFDLNMSKF